MSLDKSIKQQYFKRSNKSNLYGNSIYNKYVTAGIKKGINYYLNKYFSEPNNVKLLEIGAGNGTNAYMFTEAGLLLKNISFNELLPERIEQIKINFPENILYEGDILNTSITEKFDVIFQSTVFTSILDSSARKNIVNYLHSLLKPGGIILWYDFIYNNPSNKDVKKVSIKELKQLSSFFASIEIKKITLAPPIGRRVGYLYKMFNVPFFRSHILAVIKK